MFDDLPGGGASGGEEPAAAVEEGTGADDAKGAELLHPSADDAPGKDEPKEGDDDKPKEGDDDKPKEGDEPKEGDDDKPKEGDKDDKDKDDDGVPEKYEFTMPEGMTLDEAAAEAATPMFKELGLSNEQAQKLVDFYAGERAKIENANYEAWVDAQTEWQAAVKSDKEVGGKDLEEKVGVANKALSKFGTPELKEAMLATGAGNHVEFVRFAYRVGKAMSEDAIGSGPGQPETEIDKAKLLFPDQN